MNRKKALWVGRYHEDAIEYGFKGSICLYGKNDEFTHVYTQENGRLIDFIRQIISEQYQKYDYFFFYDPVLIYYLPSHLRDKCRYANKRELYKWLNDKSISRTWIKEIVKTPPFAILSNVDIYPQKLMSLFRGYHKFIVQEMISNSGKGTYLCSDDIMPDLNLGLYIVSPYYEDSISINVTVMVSNSACICFKPSMQIIEYIDGKLQYRGSDFLAAKSLTTATMEKIYEASNNLCNYLKDLGYRGICGIDFLLYCNDIFFLEFNPRFQGSSFLIEKAISMYGKSILDMQSTCFLNEISQKEKAIVEEIDIPYAFKDQGEKRQLLQKATTHIYIDPSKTNYYDYFSNLYHLMLPDWEHSIKTQGAIFKKIFDKYSDIYVNSVLDCTCGIGIQSMALAKLGYQVTGSDISKGELQWAKSETLRRGLSVEYIYADCRNLEDYIEQQFDAVISIDSALPHLVSQENFLKAFKSIYNRLNCGGIFVSSYRDYAKLINQHPNMAYPVRFRKKDNNEYTILRRWDWDENIIYSRQYVIEETDTAARLLTAKYTQWAVTKEDLFPIAKDAGFTKRYWLLPEESGFSQPILCLVK